MPSAQPSTASIDPGSRMTSPGTSPAATPQPTWPSTIPAAGAIGAKQPDPPAINTSTTGESSYQTRYPQLQPSSSVPATPKAGQNPND
jgi:hypothetical protein